MFERDIPVFAYKVRLAPSTIDPAIGPRTEEIAHAFATSNAISFNEGSLTSVVLISLKLKGS